MLVEQKDFDCVGEVAIHCDPKKLCIAIDEAESFDLANLFCDFWPDIVEMFKSDERSEVEELLIEGGDYEGCNGKTKHHYGIRRILVYYAYARYCLINNFNDTPNGSVSKTNDFSIPKSIKELEYFSEKYRNMGYESFKRTLDFICHNRDSFEGAKCLDCKICGCGCDACGGTKAKGFGYRSKNIRRDV